VRVVGVFRAAVLTIILAGLAGCSTATPAATTRPASLAAQPSAAAPGGQPASADGLCGTFTEDLALAALGEPLAEPSGGDVVPRPNGISCHYAAAANANTNVEAQLKDMTRSEFDTLTQTIGTTTALPGVGEVAFQRDGSIMGSPGVTIAAWANGRGVSVTISRDADKSALLAAASAIAAKALLAP
jgi:hypothetical protein